MKNPPSFVSQPRSKASSARLFRLHRDRGGVFVIAILCAWLVCCFSVQAWDGEGHMVTAQIAYNHLTPVAKAKCDLLIAQPVLYSSTINSNFVSSACWADDIKSQTSAFSAWHYVDYPFSLDGTSTNSFVTPTANVVWAINNCIVALQNPATSVSNQAFNLRFLIHFMGDITQPLHCSTAISANHPSGDSGGNSFSLSGSPNNLHSLWDEGGNYLTDSVTRPFTPSSLAIITNKAADVETTYPYSVGFTSLQNVTNWALEAWYLAQTVSYVGITEGSTPTSSYFASAASTTRQRMAIGGDRLADLLNLLMAPHTNVVVNTNDSGVGSLRYTVANSQLGDIVTFTNTLSGQTIFLTNGVILLSNYVTIDASALAKGIVLNGRGADRVFAMAPGSTATLVALTISNGIANNPSYGGGVLNYDSAATLTMSNCTVVGNSSPFEGGGLYNVGTTLVYQCTFAGNTTGANGGGGVYNDGTMVLNQSTVSGNTSTGASTGSGVVTVFGTLAMTNTLVAGNNSPSGQQLGYGTFTGANNLTNGNALLAALGNYGGPTPTLPPLGGSPAIDQGAATTLTADQRGFPRRSGAGVDIGAVETQIVTTNYSLGKPTRFANGSIQFTLTNLAGGSFTLFATTNAALPFNAWSNLGLLPESPVGSGHFQFTDLQATNYGLRFYRLRSP